MRSININRTWATVVIVGGLTACGGLPGSAPAEPVKTAATFCATYNEEKRTYLQKYESLSTPIAEDDPQAGSKILVNLFMGVQSLGDVTVILTKLEKAAPDDIQPDVAAVLESWKKSQETIGEGASQAFNPKGMVGVLLKGMFASIASNGSWTRVGDYVNENCT